MIGKNKAVGGTFPCVIFFELLAFILVEQAYV